MLVQVDTWRDIGFQLRIRVPNEAHDGKLAMRAEFTLHLIRDGEDVNGSNEFFVEGTIKWDGCANTRMGDDTANYRHTCCLEQLENIGAALVRTWCVAQLLIPKAEFKDKAAEKLRALGIDHDRIESDGAPA